MRDAPPVLLLIFNRPSTTRHVIDAVRLAAPSRLYVAGDGPRPTHPDDPNRCAAARQVATAVDWPCDVQTLFQDSNVGCRTAVSEAIDWFFDHETEGIILEDDLVPDQSFFPFCAELLERYRHDQQVMAIGGHYRAAQSPPFSYTFSRYPHIWGWATWRSAWQRYDRNLTAWPALRDTGWLDTKGGRWFAHGWRQRFDAVADGQIDSWAYAWVFSLFVHDGLAAVAGRNLIANIGFGGDATHTHTSIRQPDVGSLEMPLTHPTEVRPDPALDAWIDRKVFGAGRLPVRRAVGRVPGMQRMARWLRHRST